MPSSSCFTRKRRSLDGKNKRTKFTSLCKVAECREALSKLNWTLSHSAFTVIKEEAVILFKVKINLF